ncbi:hypothetical protein DTO164E3_9109 [Paecilomyces variotii]|nr:hypothetical protein DTO164E3_9109 [Paecilomyces variotii]
MATLFNDLRNPNLCWDIPESREELPLLVGPLDIIATICDATTRYIHAILDGRIPDKVYQTWTDKGVIRIPFLGQNGRETEFTFDRTGKQEETTGATGGNNNSAIENVNGGKDTDGRDNNSVADNEDNNTEAGNRSSDANGDKSSSDGSLALVVNGDPKFWEAPVFLLPKRFLQ